MNPAFILLYGVFITAAPVVGQFAIMAAQSNGRFFWGMGSGMLIWGCILLGFVLSLVCLGFWMAGRSAANSGGAYARASIVGAVVGVLGAYPVGFLTFSTTLVNNLGLGRPVGVLLTGIYLALMFGGYMLLWERHEARRRRGNERS
ncbi:hypothetical protein GCM10020360_16520 [Nonlabens tegetincola]